MNKTITTPQYFWLLIGCTKRIEKKFSNLLPSCRTEIVSARGNIFTKNIYNLNTMTEIGGLRKHEKTQHALC